ncbi:MAG TPA: hypothetical protein VEZ11_13105 [Thermoanaerobaculia bacterium]|nr:hypothetical protein [Thermoanaerobaculia bacterium]
MPKETRRRVLEAAVRAPQDWQREAIREAYDSKDQEWRLTAVFGMKYHRRFDAEILEALNSKDEDTHCEAIEAAGNWELDAAWSHVVALVESRKTAKPLLLAAIGAIATIRPAEAGEILAALLGSRDQDIAAAAEEALAMMDHSWDEDDDFDDDDDEILH